MENKDKTRAYQRKYRAEHFEEQREKDKRWREAHRNERREKTKRTRIDQRKIVIARYGGKCSCCGEDRYEFLAIDHTDGGGNEHRKEVGPQRIAAWLIQQGFPGGFRILCHNCNMAHGMYGYCPHERERNGQHA